MKFKARVHTSLKKSVLDPQGQTTLHALETMGFKEARSIRIGKYFELVLEAADRKKAEESLHAMCDKLLHNPVIEEYSFEIQEMPL
ncbi:MAG TPA: phosphoribosylformylglycinamidine synthase subunit PurS [Candidatus Omnitrophota bacterium]|nr:phosphoribosylformylglycinamidine synthase subunit PurS [Candidatus Omnitrophota bacterium]HPS37325.1 phosphoribosylformylglycinamidine synthase subunit PurS [Candidatus Omnitrophota bacterium]